MINVMRPAAPAPPPKKPSFGEILLQGLIGVVPGAIGTLVGGPAGGALGGALGNAAAGALGGQAQQQAPGTPASVQQLQAGDGADDAARKEDAEAAMRRNAAMRMLQEALLGRKMSADEQYAQDNPWAPGASRAINPRAYGMAMNRFMSGAPAGGGSRS